MKRIAIFLICLLSGCATPTDKPTIALLIDRMDRIEMEPTSKSIKPVESIVEPPRDYYNAYPNRLNDAQKDFVQFMLNYLADED